MAEPTNALWLNSSAVLGQIHRPFTQQIQGIYPLQEWSLPQQGEVRTDQDSLLRSMEKLLKQQQQPLHLIGHGIGGILGWWCACQYPEQVRSVTLLGVGATPALNWQTYGLMMREGSVCSQERLLAHLVGLLWGPQPLSRARQWIGILEQELTGALLPLAFLSGRPLARDKPLSVPVWIGGGQRDLIVSATQIRPWQTYLHPRDQLWICPDGYHFFHLTFPQQVAAQVLKFWQGLDRQERN